MALSTIYESYVEHCEGKGTTPLLLSQLKSLLQNTFPKATFQIEEVHGIKEYMIRTLIIGLQLLDSGVLNQSKLAQGNEAEISRNDLFPNLIEEISDQGYNGDHVQTDEQRLDITSQYQKPSNDDLDQRDLNTHMPQQLIGGGSAWISYFEPSYATEAEPISKIRENRRAAQNYQQAVENRHITEVEICKGIAKRLSHIITWMRDNGQTEILLRDFAHSASCGIINCSPFCRMLRRVRRHVVSAKHPCVLLRLYSLLLRLHVNSCTNDNCGLQACPTLRANKSVKRTASSGPITRSKRIAPNPLLVPRVSSNNTGNQIVVVMAIPANGMEGPSIAKIKN